MTETEHDLLVAKAIKIEHESLALNDWSPRLALVSVVGFDYADVRYAACGDDWILALKEWAMEKAKDETVSRPIQ